ncbi:hypothetical protein PYW07_011701 [Mythimna separata]|uniref:Thyroglobulin type-1 domain-containing protein n=1 Tax=Mythimna separata TaxID=271217 RepID=A0AAD8DK52_MYTSE|nr:hypothetical protein PYW07_011701 [Mythimna separata]
MRPGVHSNNDILCEQGFCRSFRFDVGCADQPIHCDVMNATHSGVRLPSPTLCNCCDFCMPFIEEGEHCISRAPGTGNTVGRCGDGLNCTAIEDDKSGWGTCSRMQSKCHDAQDDYDARALKEQTGAMEYRPHCDGKGKYAPYDCIPAHTCFCQSEEGERLFGEVRNLGAITERTMQCGCSRFHDRMRKTISSGVPFPVIGPRCTADGNFYPIQCVANRCYCVNVLTGVVEDQDKYIDLERKPITKLECYDEDLDLYKEFSEGKPPYNFTTPCLLDLKAKIDLILQSEEEGFNVDYFRGFQECLPDGTFGRTGITRDGRKICIDERGAQIGNYEVNRTSADFETMDCKCAQTTNIMGDVPEKPICCKNGSFRPIQCRRGMCRCVDPDGKQYGLESADVTLLGCYTSDWRTC